MEQRNLENLAAAGVVIMSITASKVLVYTDAEGIRKDRPVTYITPSGESCNRNKNSEINFMYKPSLRKTAHHVLSIEFEHPYAYQVELEDGHQYRIYKNHNLVEQSVRNIIGEKGKTFDIHRFFRN